MLRRQRLHLVPIRPHTPPQYSTHLFLSGAVPLDLHTHSHIYTHTCNSSDPTKISLKPIIDQCWSVSESGCCCNSTALKQIHGTLVASVCVCVCVRSQITEIKRRMSPSVKFNQFNLFLVLSWDTSRNIVVP